MKIIFPNMKIFTLHKYIKIIKIIIFLYKYYTIKGRMIQKFFIMPKDIPIKVLSSFYQSKPLSKII